MTTTSKRLPGTALVVAGLMAALVALPAFGQGPRNKVRKAETGLKARLSQSVIARTSFEGTIFAGQSLGSESLGSLTTGATATRAPAATRSASGAGPRIVGDVFNDDIFGLPQNEESLQVCRKDPDIVLEGTNDYRGLLFPDLGEPFTGWHFSTDGGRSLLTEGLLPPVDIGGEQVAPGGDPVVQVDNKTCELYAGSLNFAFGPVFPDDFFPNGIGLYKSDPETLASCGGGVDPSCWPTRKAVAVAPNDQHFYDKEWFDIGRSGSAGKVVWVAFADFLTDLSIPAGFTASIKAVRCDSDLNNCTDPILISDDDPDVQFADVTVARDGRTYITWSEILGEPTGDPQTFVHKMRVAPPGSTDFGPERVVFEETKAIPFGGKLHSNDLRIATYPKNEVKTTRSGSRAYVTWDACAVRVFFESICEEPVIKLTYSDDAGATWSSPRVVSAGGDNYFPAIADAAGSSKLAVAYFTNRYDSVFHNRQDVELVTLNRNGGVLKRQRLTRPSNEPEADPLLGGAFIGDYIEVDVERGRAYVGYNANYRSVPLLGEGVPIPQQDNYITSARL